jgi:hypothetical protein
MIHNHAVTRMIGMEVVEPAYAGNIPFVDGEMMFLNEGLHVFELPHDASGGADYVQEERRVDFQNDDVTDLILGSVGVDFN